MKILSTILSIILLLQLQVNAQRQVISFNTNWKFSLQADSTAIAPSYNDKNWRIVELPHDWSIELPFSANAPATNQGGALPGGIGWYRKTFTLPTVSKNNSVFIQFDGVYKNSEVWINGHYLGKRPNGYISFQYNITSFLQSKNNIIVVKVDNSLQPNSRWYSGSGIYRSVQLLIQPPIAFDRYGVFISSTIQQKNNQAKATVNIQSTLHYTYTKNNSIQVQHIVYDALGKKVAATPQLLVELKDTSTQISQQVLIEKAKLWSIQQPYLYTVVSIISKNGKQLDKVVNQMGVRSFHFDAAKGFFLNNQPLKILGVCLHHDAGALGAVENISAIERQLLLLKKMGCNAIRTAHNPPSIAFLDACDRMGFLVMDEAFDMWKKKKNKYDYNIDFLDWYKADLEEQIKRDRNHPSVFMWSIGNEIREQFDSTGTIFTKKMVQIVKQLDNTRPVTAALTENIPSKNFITKAQALDVLGFNYKHTDYDSLPNRFPNMPLLATETASALATRGVYILPADSLYIWPPNSKTTTTGNADFTCSAYDNTFAYWGATHEESWLAVKNKPFMAGLFVWSGFDFLGEPVPYPYPARSSYYGIIDLAGIPKDVYYMYQSEWTNKTVLHILPHWNWTKNDTIDVWVYYNNADSVELFLNNLSYSKKAKTDQKVHVSWKIPYQAGTLTAKSYKAGKLLAIKHVKTAQEPARFHLEIDKRIIHLRKKELSYIAINVVDKDGNLVPFAQNKIEIVTDNLLQIIGIDNGNPTSTDSFKSSVGKAFNGKMLVILKPSGSKGIAKIKIQAEGLQPITTNIFIQ